MAYRRKQGNPRSSSTLEDLRPTAGAVISGEPTPALAAQAIRASSAHRDSSISSAYGESAFSRRSPLTPARSAANDNEYSSKKTFDGPRGGFWGVLARKAKTIVEDDHARQLEHSSRNHLQTFGRPTDDQFHHSTQLSDSHWKDGNPTIHKRLDAITSSLNNIGGRAGNAFEEGFSAVENRTANIIQETHKLNIRRKVNGSNNQSHAPDIFGFPQLQTDNETQLKASRDVANAMAAKAKLLMRELKTVKADLAFAKERCSQLEEENKILRESSDRGDHPEDDDLVRLQLETLLAEKARLTSENSVFARENRFLREIVEYHQLTMQEIAYLNGGIGEVAEIYHYPTTPLSNGPSRSPSPSVHTPPGSEPHSEQPSIASEGLPPPTSAADPTTVASTSTSQDAIAAAVPENAPDSASMER